MSTGVVLPRARKPAMTEMPSRRGSIPAVRLILDALVEAFEKGRIATGGAYGDAATFLDGASYKNLIRWNDEVASRPAVQRGLMVNRTSGEPAGQLWERHDASDFDLRTQDKL